MCEIYCAKVEGLVQKVLRQNLDEEDLVKYFLVHCLGDVEMKREIKIRKAVEKENIKKIIKNIDNVNETEDQVTALRSGNK